MNAVAWQDALISFPSLLDLASIGKIEAATRQIIREAAPGNRVLIAITEDIPEDRWQANMLAIARVIDQEARERRLRSQPERNAL